MGQFKDQVVFITGASSGIGEALTKAFAEEGAKLVLAARRLDRLQSLANEFEKNGVNVLIEPCDVTKDGDLEKAVQATREKFGGIDVVIANAGFGVKGRLDQLKIDDFRRQLETNLFGVLRTIYATLPDLKKSKGRLALMGSISGHFSVPELSPYSVSKYGVRAIAETLFTELERDGVSVTLISPGFVESEIYQVSNKGVFNPKQKAMVPRWIRMPTRKAARQMLRAIAKRKREIIVTGHGKIIVFFKRHFPGFMAWVIRRFYQRSNKMADVAKEAI